MEKFKICFLVLILSLILVGMSKALTCSIKSSCGASEQCIFSTYQANDTHAGNCSAYTNKYCCSDPFLTSASVKEFCGIGEFGILAFYNYTDAHAETFNNSVLELRFEENSGDLTFDSSGKGNHGKIYGASWTDGKYGKALSFDGVDDYVDTPTPNPGGGNFTVCAWIKNPTDGGRIVAQDETNPSGGWSLSLGDPGTLNDIRFFYRGAAVTNLDATGLGLTDGNWHFICGVRNPTDGIRKIYHNGAIVAQITSGDTYTANPAQKVIIGGESSASSEYPGVLISAVIDEVRIYNRALTEEEIKSLYYQQRVCVSCPWVCEVKPSCSAGEFNVTSLYQLTNTHLAEPAYYSSRLCCKREDFVPIPLGQTQNNSNPNVGEAVLLSVYWKDNGNLSYAILATNESGIWQNKTTYGSPLQLNHFQKWSNFTWQNSSVPATTTVAWKVYVNDSCGNWNVSDTFTFKTRESNPPFYSLNSTNSTIAGTAVMHSLFWQDDTALSGYIFSWCNGTYGSYSVNTYNWTSPDQEPGTKRFNTTAISSSTSKVAYYNFTDYTNNKAYNGTVASGNFPPQWGDGWGGSECPNYDLLQTNNSQYFIAYGSSNNEPFERFNFTINQSASYIDWIYILLDGYIVYGGGEDGDCFIANFNSQSWSKLWDIPSDQIYTINLTTNIQDYIDANKQLVLLCEGKNLDTGDNVYIDFVEVRVGYKEYSYTPVYEQNSSWQTYESIDGSDYQNIDLVKAIITIDSYNPSASNLTYNENNRPDIEVGIWNGSQYINGFYCQANSSMGNNLPNTTDWNCTITTTNSAIRNAWKLASNRKLQIRGIWLDAYDNTIIDEINVTAVFAYLDAWNTSGEYGECSEENAPLTNETWVPFTGNPKSAWSNVTKIITSQPGKTVKWCVYANDTSNNWNATSCQNPFSYVTIPYTISAELSPKLAEGIFFTNRTGAEINQQFPIHIDWNNATWNYNASSKKTEYWVNNTGTVAFDLCLKANSHLTCSSGSCTGLTIDISNVAWNNSTLTDANNPSFDTSKRLSLSYQKVAFNVAPSQLIYFRFWVYVPFGQPSGIYNTTFTAEAVDVGTTC